MMDWVSVFLNVSTVIIEGGKGGKEILLVCLCLLS